MSCGGKVDSGGTVLLRYKTGVATLVISKCSHSFNKSELQTENGTILIDHLGEWSQIGMQKKGDKEATPLTVPPPEPAPPNNLWWELDAFVKLVQQGKQEDEVLSWELMTNVTAVLDAARADAGIIYPADAKPKF